MNYKCNLNSNRLKNNLFCLLKLNSSKYYTITVG